MLNAPLCPDRDDLQRFLLGEVSEYEIDELEFHLTQCPDCLQTIHGLEVQDTLVAALQAQAETLHPEADEQIEAMIRRLQALPSFRGDDATDSDSPSSVNDEPSAAVPSGALSQSAVSTEEGYSFLRPPGGPGELGRLGGYRILSVLGTGGMGIVFRAEDVQLGRQVALKVPRAGLHGSATARKRFLREVRAAAAVEHEHVVHINEIGEDGGILYVAMPLLQGENLEARLRRQGRLEITETLRIGREIAEGLAAAHERGLIHRDIKPANIWLEGERGRVKILDFGLARPAAGEAAVTHSGFVVGTPAYMAPEQAQGGTVDQRSDLFSLGCLLYRMLTAELPFPGANALAVFHALALKEPAPLRQLNRHVPLALEQVVQTLLAKEPAQRPASALLVAQTLHKLEQAPPSPEEDKPSVPSSAPLAEPRPERPKLLPSRLTLPWRSLVGRRGRILLAGLALLLAGFLWVFAHPLMNFLANRGELVVDTDRGVLVLVHQGGSQRRTFHAEVRQSFDLPAGDYEVEVVEAPGGVLLQKGPIHLPRGGRQSISVPSSPPLDEKPSPRKLVFPATLQGVGAPVYGLAISPDGKHLAAVGPWKAKVWDLTTGEESVVLEDAKAPFLSIAFRPDGQQLVGGGLYSLARVWDLSSGKLLLEKRLLGEVRNVAYTPDGKHLISPSILWLAGGPTNTRGRVELWEESTGAEEFVFADEAKRIPQCAACSPDGKQVAAAMIQWDPGKVATAGTAEIRVWEADGGKRIHSLTGPSGEIRGLAYSPDGNRLRCSAFDGTVWGWEARSGRPLPPLRGGHTTGVTAIAFNKDGRRLASGSKDGSICIWDLAEKVPDATLRGHRGRIDGLAFSPDDRLVASGSADGLIKIWEVPPPRDKRP